MLSNRTRLFQKKWQLISFVPIEDSASYTAIFIGSTKFQKSKKIAFLKPKFFFVCLIQGLGQKGLLDSCIPTWKLAQKSPFRTKKCHLCICFFMCNHRGIERTLNAATGLHSALVHQARPAKAPLFVAGTKAGVGVEAGHPRGVDFRLPQRPLHWTSLVSSKRHKSGRQPKCYS